MKITSKSDYVLIDSQKNGIKTAIFVGIHGDEICGILAIKEILKKITINSGSVMFVYGNMKAIKEKSRLTEFNLNRAFKNPSFYNRKIKKTYEYKRAQVLKEYLSNIDLLLDVHSVSDKKSEPFIICEKNGYKIIKSFSSKFNKIVSGLELVQPGGVDGYMNSIGKIGICIECGYHKDPESVSLAKETILRFLQKTGNIKNRISKKFNYKRIYIKITDQFITKSDAFILSKSFPNFEKIKKGDIVGVDGKIKIKSKEDGLILFAHNRRRIGEEAFYLGQIIKNKVVK